MAPPKPFSLRSRTHRPACALGQVDLVVRVPETWAANVFVRANHGTVRAEGRILGQILPWRESCEAKLCATDLKSNAMNLTTPEQKQISTTTPAQSNSATTPAQAPSSTTTPRDEFGATTPPQPLPPTSPLQDQSISTTPGDRSGPSTPGESK